MNDVATLSEAISSALTRSVVPKRRMGNIGFANARRFRFSVKPMLFWNRVRRGGKVSALDGIAQILIVSRASIML